MTPSELAALNKRARRGAALTGRPVADVLEEMLAAYEGRRRGEFFRARERYEEERPERERAAAAYRRFAAVIAVVAGGMPYRSRRWP